MKGNKLENHWSQISFRDYKNRQWAWSKSDFHEFKHLTVKEPEVPKQILGLFDNIRTVVQAGGAHGLYADQYAQYVDKVYTFEPGPVQFTCLKYNIARCDNVVAYNAALGNKTDDIPLRVIGHNTGGSYVFTKTERFYRTAVMVKQIRLDSLGLAPDLIHLDVEGYEPYAIEGGLETINKYFPHIVVERGQDGDITKDVLADLGYEKKLSLRSDDVYTHRDRK